MNSPGPHSSRGSGGESHKSSPAAKAVNAGAKSEGTTNPFAGRASSEGMDSQGGQATINATNERGQHVDSESKSTNPTHNEAAATPVAPPRIDGLNQ